MIIEAMQKQNTQWFFRIKADNGKTLAHSETYKRKESVFKALHAMGYKGKIAHVFPKSGMSGIVTI